MSEPAAEYKTSPQLDPVTGAYQLDTLAPCFGLAVASFRRRVLGGAIALPTYQLMPSRKAPRYVSKTEWEKYLKRREKSA